MFSHFSHYWFDIIAAIVLACSILSAILPPYEVFAFAPRFQTAYRITLVFISTIGALNLRRLTMKLYPSYQQSFGNMPQDKGGKNALQDSPNSSPANPAP